MKKEILKMFINFQALNSNDIMNLNGYNFENNTFKLHLLKDQKKGAKVSDNKFYVVKDDCFIKFEYDEILNKLIIISSKEIENLALYIKSLKNFKLKKIEVCCTDMFIDLQQQLLEAGYIVELIRKERFFNNNTYQNEVVLSYLREIN